MAEVLWVLIFPLFLLFVTQTSLIRKFWLLRSARYIVYLESVALKFSQLFLCAPPVTLSLPRPRCWRRPRVKWNGVIQSPACSWHSRPRPPTNRNQKSSEWPSVPRARGTRMCRHERHVIGRASGLALSYAANAIGLEIHLSEYCSPYGYLPYRTRKTFKSTQRTVLSDNTTTTQEEHQLANQKKRKPGWTTIPYYDKI